MTSPESALVEAKNVSRVFPVRGGRVLRAVDSVSLQLADNETVALVGESGSGKTTLGRVLLRLLEPTSGTIAYRGQDVATLNGDRLRSFRREVQVVFQDSGSAFNPRQTIGTSLMVPLTYNRKLPKSTLKATASALLEQVGLPAATFLDRYPHELSGGQRQRVGIARALASEPRLIVADEPVSALDVSVRAQVLGVMRDLQVRSKLTYLFITHDLGVVRAIADRVIVMYLGAIVETGPVEAVFRAPGHPYTRALLAATPVPDPTRRQTGVSAPARLAGEIPSATDIPSGCRFHTRCPLAQEVCRTTVPAMVRFADSLESACHFATDVRDEVRREARA
jgi:oligopeptide/dipeptide ABC transporter ATP-binding protein